MEYGPNIKSKNRTNGLSRAGDRWSRAAAIGAMIIGASSGCGQEAPPSAPAKADLSAHRAVASSLTRTLNVQDAPGASLGKYRMFWPKRNQADVADRISKIATVLSQKKTNVVSQTVPGVDFARLLDDNRIEVAYDGRYDTLTVRDEALVKGMEKSPSDIGEKEAQSAMKEVFDELVTAGLVDSRHYDLGSSRPSHHYVRTGSNDGAPVQEMVVEYRFRVLRKLNGIDVPNNGIITGIAPSGKRSSIKVGGVQVDSIYDGIEEQPTQALSVVLRKASIQDLGKRFDKEVSPGKDKRISWNKLMYVMPEGATTEAVVEPTMVYRFSEAVVRPGGDTSLAPAKLYAFSLSDDSVPPQDLSSR